MLVNSLQIEMNRGKLREKLDANEISERGAQREEFAMRMEEMKMINILCLLGMLSSNKQDVSQCFVLYFQEFLLFRYASLPHTRIGLTSTQVLAMTAQQQTLLVP
jgi:hypothetical protein